MEYLDVEFEEEYEDDFSDEDLGDDADYGYNPSKEIGTWRA